MKRSSKTNIHEMEETELRKYGIEDVGGGVTETVVVTAVVTVDDCGITTAGATLDDCGIMDAGDEACSDTSTAPSPFCSLFNWMTVM